MKIYQLAPDVESDWLSPNQVSEAFNSAFFGVDIDAAAAAKFGAQFLAKYRVLRDAGLGDDRSLAIDELERSWKGALCLTVQIDEEPAGFLITVARNLVPLELGFSAEVSRRRHRAIAKRAADALGYDLLTMDGD